MPVKNRLSSSVSVLPSRLLPLRQAKALASLALLCFCLLAFLASPALAQYGGGGYPGEGGAYGRTGWVIDHFAVTGTRTSPGSPDQTLPDLQVYPNGNSGYHQSYGRSLNASITAVFRWLGPGSPPPVFYAKINAHADAHNLDGSPGNADNGFGDPSAGNSTGTHLIQKKVGAGATMLSIGPYSLSASGDDEGPTIDFGAVWDDRGVTITCPDVDTNANGGSKYREPALTGAIITNAREDDGTLRGDSVVDSRSAASSRFSFTANLAGGWNLGSEYHWYASTSGMYWSGVLLPLDDFATTEFPSNIGSTDHIFISLSTCPELGLI